MLIYVHQTENATQREDQYLRGSITNFFPQSVFAIQASIIFNLKFRACFKYYRDTQQDIAKI